MHNQLTDHAVQCCAKPVRATTPPINISQWNSFVSTYWSVWEMHLSTIFNKCAFSSAAATRSLSLSCLLTRIDRIIVITKPAIYRWMNKHIPESSDWWVPGVIAIVILYLLGRERNSFTRKQSPINVAMLQWGIVGVKKTWTVLSLSETVIFST